MANFFSKGFAEAAKKDPPFAPFAVPKISDKPWIAPLRPRERAAKFRTDDIQRKKSMGDPHHVSLQSWVLYMIRFIFTGDLSDVWSSFGGISSQLSHWSIALRQAVTETASFAIAYDLELRRMAERLARRRDPDCDPPKILRDGNEEIKRYSKVDLGKGRNNSSFIPDPKRTPRPKQRSTPRSELPPQAP